MQLFGVKKILLKLTVVSSQINSDWDCLHANKMLTSFKTDILIYWF
jgi:hypothetical protein